MEIQEFKDVVWSFARTNARDMPWRTKHEPYDVLVSEIMLQQTQVERVIPKFKLFMARFPGIESLAKAQLSEVLVLWSGLGYNRRAKFLHASANKIIRDFGGSFPQTKEQLITLPGVGHNTAGAILAYAFNQPTVFIETNIRTVYFNHFFQVFQGASLENLEKGVSDKQLHEKVAQTLDREHPREWYWALMDYGAYLKKNGAGRLTQSSHYKKQSPLAGSLREMRGRIVKALSLSPYSEKQLKEKVIADKRFKPALQSLLYEELIKRHRGELHLA